MQFDCAGTLTIIVRRRFGEDAVGVYANASVELSWRSLLVAVEQMVRPRLLHSLGAHMTVTK